MSFKDAANVADVDERDGWYRAYYAKVDGLFDMPSGLRRVPRPPDKLMLLQLSTLYKLKSDGRKKARCVLGRCRLWQVRDFELTFSPTVKHTTLCLVLALAAKHDLKLKGGDVTPAYLQADWQTDQTVYARMPAGYGKYDEDGHDGSPGRPPRSYLPMASRIPNTTIATFYLTKGTDGLIVLLYVDANITAQTRGMSLRSDWAEHFSSKFHRTDFGADFQEFVSIRLRRRPGVVHLDSERYTTELASEIFPGVVHHACCTGDSRAALPG
eukprot:6186679-Pleurochrysis_carterae.AAC.2